ncbi:MAG: hypothetical protein ACKON8_04955, partial [Planctomycetota bacterium]
MNTTRIRRAVPLAIALTAVAATGGIAAESSLKWTPHRDAAATAGPQADAPAALQPTPTAQPDPAPQTAAGARQPAVPA